MTEVVAALIWDRDKFMICQRPAHKARGLLWEFVGGKVEPGETKEQALIRECREELAITLSVSDVFMDVVHEYPDLTVHLTLFNATIAEGEPQRLEHNDIQWITPSEIQNFDFCPADKEILDRIVMAAKHKTLSLVEDVYPYFRILKTINDNLTLLINNNVESLPYVNEELFYLISSDLIRLLPYKIPRERSSNAPMYDRAFIDDTCGIALLKSDLPMLNDGYEIIIKNKKCLEVLEVVRVIRNKYIHEPHNVRFAFFVGGKTSCSIGLSYKDNLYSVSTIWLTNIVYELNEVFQKIQAFCIQEMTVCGDKYDEYYCYQFIREITLEEYNRSYDRMPWEYITINDEFDELCEGKDKE